MTIVMDEATRLELIVARVVAVCDQTRQQPLPPKAGVLLQTVVYLCLGLPVLPDH